MVQAAYPEQAGYPVQFSVDYPDRPLNRLTTAFRIFLVIPIAILLSTVSGYLVYSAPTHAYGVTYIPALTGGVLFWAPLLMILFRRKYPRWWFDWNLELQRFAFFADDLEGQHVHGGGIVHLALAVIAFLCVAIGTVLISVSLRSDPAWHPAGTVLFAVSLAGAAALLLLGAGFGHKHGPGGLYERIFLGLELLWIALTAGYIAAGRPRLNRPG